LTFKQRLDKSPGSRAAKTTCSSSASQTGPRARQQPIGPAYKRRTAQSCLFGLSALRTAHSHADTLVWICKSCASATPQYTCISLCAGENKAIPSSLFPPYLSSLHHRDGDKILCTYQGMLQCTAAYKGSYRTPAQVHFLFSRTKCYGDVLLSPGAGEDAPPSEEQVLPDVGRTAVQRSRAERDYKCMWQKPAVEERNWDESNMN